MMNYQLDQWQFDSLCRAVGIDPEHFTSLHVEHGYITIKNDQGLHIKMPIEGQEQNEPKPEPKSGYNPYTWNTHIIGGTSAGNGHVSWGGDVTPKNFPDSQVQAKLPGLDDS